MKVEIFPIDHSRDSLLKYSIVGTELKDRGWIFVRHKLRNTWELPAGHIEEGETAL